MLNPARPRMRFFVVAAEESGDRLGAALMQALLLRVDAEFSGIGGRAMQEAGLESLFPIDALSIVGLAAIPRRLPMILRRIREASDAALAYAPDALIIIDSPDFTQRVARRVRRKSSSIAIINYVSPSVWAWRPGRAKRMAQYIDHVLALLPFEPQAHMDLGGPPCTYVGHPLIEEIASLRPNASEAARRQSDPPSILVLPGSRMSEIKRLLQPFGQAIEIVAAQIGELDLVLPTVPNVHDEVRRQIATWRYRPRLIVDIEEKRQAFRTARAALAASGTVTLELALGGVPTIAAYRVSPIEAAIARRVVKTPTIILANLVLGENIMPEFIQEMCTPERLAAALIDIIKDTPERAQQVKAFAQLDRIMNIGSVMPSMRAAEIVIEQSRRKTGARGAI